MTRKYQIIYAEDQSLSRELQIGKVAEHLVCADLILQGYNAFLADQGLPYDVVVDTPVGLKRVQVKATRGAIDLPRQKNVYRFGTRRSKGNRQRIDLHNFDFFAFVALDIKAIAYLPISQMVGRTGGVTMCIEFKSRHLQYDGRTYSNGTRREPYGRFLQDFEVFQC